jgi:hypothetical protein
MDNIENFSVEWLKFQLDHPLPNIERLWYIQLYYNARQAIALERIAASLENGAEISLIDILNRMHKGE